MSHGLSVLFFYLLIFGLILFLFIRGISALICGNRDKIAWLKREVPKWEEKNLISAKQAEDLFQFYKIKSGEVKKTNLITTLSVIGAALLGIGVILFVAANWQEIPPNIKTILLLAVTFGTFYIGYYLTYEKKSYAVLGKSLMFSATLFLGAAIALLGQIYHVSVTDGWIIFFIWAALILPAAYFFESPPIFMLSSSLFLLWNYFYTIGDKYSNYYYPLIVFILILPFAKNDKLKSIFNITALVFAAALSVFYKQDWVILVIAAGLLIYHLLPYMNFPAGKLKETKPPVYEHFYNSCLIGSSLAFAAWSISFFLSYDKLPNYFFIIILGILFYLTYKAKSKEALFVNICSLIVWFNLFFAALYNNFSSPQSLSVPDMLLINILLGIIIYLAGLNHIKEKIFKNIYTACGFAIVLIISYILSFKNLFWQLKNLNSDYIYLCAFIVLSLIIVYLIFINLVNKKFLAKTLFYEILIMALIILASFTGFFTHNRDIYILLVMNITLLLCGFIIILQGFEKQNAGLFNSGILILVIFAFTRYFDLFWSYLDRSLFFIIIGIFILIYATLMEKQRRKIIGDMKNE